MHGTTVKIIEVLVLLLLTRNRQRILQGSYMKTAYKIFA